MSSHRAKNHYWRFLSKTHLSGMHRAHEGFINTLTVECKSVCLCFFSSKSPYINFSKRTMTQKKVKKPLLLREFRKSRYYWGNSISRDIALDLKTSQSETVSPYRPYFPLRSVMNSAFTTYGHKRPVVQNWLVVPSLGKEIYSQECPWAKLWVRWRQCVLG